MGNVIDTINRKPNAIMGTGASDDAIKEAEQSLGLAFAQDYREYVKAYGLLAYDGHELTGISMSKRVGVVCVTEAEWSHNPLVSHTMYVVEQTHIDGVVVWQSESGEIFQSRPETAPVQIFKSLSDFIEQV